MDDLRQLLKEEEHSGSKAKETLGLQETPFGFASKRIFEMVDEDTQDSSAINAES